MSTYRTEIFWNRGEEKFTDGRYSRKHVWRFDGGVDVPASSSPQVVPLPYSFQEAVDPEEAFVASLSSCHLLWFLSLAAKAGWVVDRYYDAATGVLAKDARGKLAMTEVVLRPQVSFSGLQLPTRTEIESLHQAAHDACFIANSVLTRVSCEPRYEALP